MHTLAVEEDKQPNFLQFIVSQLVIDLPEIILYYRINEHCQKTLGSLFLRGPKYLE